MQNIKLYSTHAIICSFFTLINGNEIHNLKDNNHNNQTKFQSCEELCKSNLEYKPCYDDCQIVKEQSISHIITTTCLVLGFIAILFIIWKRKQVLRLFSCFFDKRKIMLEQFLDNAVIIKNSNLLITELRKVTKMLNQSSNTLIFTQNSKLHKEENICLFANPNEKDQYINISLTGDDKYGPWAGNGVAIIDCNNKLCVWFIKDYVCQQEARSSKIWEHLVYQGEFEEEIKAFVGSWSYDGFQNDITYSGTWILKIQ